MRIPTVLSIVLCLAACQDGGQEPAVPPAGLIYPQSEVITDAGQTLTIPAPQIQGTQPMTFSLAGNTVSSITMASDGSINVSAETLAGLYKPDVIVSNSAGTRTFPAAVTIRVNAVGILPTSFAYSPASAETTLGTAYTSPAPQTNGTGPLNYSITSVPAGNGQISIGPDGVIQASNSLAAGTYNISVQVSASSGNVTFTNAFTLVVKAPGTTVFFQKDIRPLMQQYCTGCHSNYSDYASVKKDVDMILNRIQRIPGAVGFMPQGGQALTQAEINLIKKWKDEGMAD